MSINLRQVFEAMHKQILWRETVVHICRGLGTEWWVAGLFVLVHLVLGAKGNSTGTPERPRWDINHHSHNDNCDDTSYRSLVTWKAQDPLNAWWPCGFLGWQRLCTSAEISHQLIHTLNATPVLWTKWWLRVKMMRKWISVNLAMITWQVGQGVCTYSQHNLPFRGQ